MVEGGPFNISPVSTTQDLNDAVKLLEQYAFSLLVDLSAQDFATEISNLNDKYSPPHGILLIARSTLTPFEALGCVALRPFIKTRPPNGMDGTVHATTDAETDDSKQYCVMKRLYTIPSARGTGLGRALALRVIVEARGMGYRVMRLDTLRSMEGARSLYASLGFGEVEAYEWAPYGKGETVFMELVLEDNEGE